MKKELRKFENTIVFLAKTFLYCLLFAVFYFMYARENWPLYNISRTSAVTIAAYIIMSYMFSNIYGRYDIGKRKSKPIVHSLFLMCLFTDVISMLALSVMNTNSRNNKTFELEHPMLILPILAIQLGVIIVFTYGGNALYFKLYDPERCVVITSSQQSLNQVIRGIKKYKLQYNIVKVADYTDKALKDYIIANDSVFIYDVPVEERTHIIEYCYQNMKNVYFNPNMHDIIEISSKHVLLDDISLLCNYSKGLTLEQKVVKRVSDIIIAGVALVLLSPIMLISAVMVKVEDKGTIIFKQNRATMNGKIFLVYKFRTMKEDVDNFSAVENDDRITRIGRILRKYRIDELPQLINVLKGDMSVVGPRPEMLANVFNYTSTLPEFEYRLRVKAGITGYAQIAGKYNTSPKDKLILDLMYIEEYSIWQDIKLIFQTFIVILKRDSTEGFKQDEFIFEKYEENCDEENIGNR